MNNDQKRIVSAALNGGGLCLIAASLWTDIVKFGPLFVAIAIGIQFFFIKD